MSHRAAIRKDRRRERLLEEIVRDPGVLIRDLAEKFEVSRETIRRDFDALCDTGQLQRRYGGAQFPVGNLLSFEARQRKHVPERRAIVKMAQRFLEDDLTVMLGPGTTALLFAEALVQSNRCLTVITNGLREALTLSKSETLKVLLAPGEVDSSEGFAWGQETTEYLTGFNADLAVVFADGLAVSGVSESDSRTVWTVKTMLRQADNNMLLLDHFRFNQQGRQKICDLDALDMVISDREPGPFLLQALKENNVAFHCA
ncbi:MAG: DeoR/GlpR family DNA-binding transcription regulator [Kiloniellales bacterium]|nr:DeoR/GlpR family DNA-binding transcription regulator [Kiloniellales bacterium]